MLIATHVAVGAVVAQNSPTAFWAFVLGFISHLLIDMIPHGDAHLYKEYKSGKKMKQALAKVSFDALAAVMLVAWVFAYVPNVNATIVAWGLVGSVLPDLLVGLCELYKHPWLEAFHRVHFWFHNYFVDRKKDMSLKHGFVMQAFLLAILVKVII